MRTAHSVKADVQMNHNAVIRVGTSVIARLDPSGTGLVASWLLGFRTVYPGTDSIAWACSFIGRKVLGVGCMGVCLIQDATEVAKEFQ